jgi:hypothetical protein
VRRALALVVLFGCGPARVPPGGAGGGVGGAGGGSEEMPDAGPPQFLAFDRDFESFRTWESFHTEGPDGGGDVHTMGPHTEYLSARPPRGSTAFPQGTVIVKVMETSSPPLIVAMAKRGGDYNDMGAPGWEWFQLDENPVQILWRGLGPPGAGTYGGNPSACNVCHLGAQPNDCVASQALQLSGL